MKISNFKFQISNRLTLSIALTLIGGFLRLYNLTWGAPFYFHPDERNIASAISQLHFPNQLNPHFFAYGSLPLYLTYFLGIIQNFFTSCRFSFSCNVTFEQAIIISRLISSFLSVLLIPLMFFISERLRKRTGLIAAALTTFSVGLIQFAHFGTVEILLTFFSLLLFSTSLTLMKSGSVKSSILNGLILGILISTKASSLVLLCLPFLLFIIQDKNSIRQKSLKGVGLVLLQIGIAGLLFVLTNPYVFLDMASFRNSMTYESSVGFGTLPVFYTAEFYNSIPVLFQLLHVYPFLLNPIILIVFLVSGIVLLRNIKQKQVFLLFFFFLLLFLSQAFLFVKWTRYMVPTLPFIYLITTEFIASRRASKKTHIPICLIASVIWGISFVITAYVEKDSRLQAVDFAEKTVPSTTPILSEVYDLGIVPFNSHYPDITLFNTYELDNGNPEYTWDTLSMQLQNTDVIILPSQRISKTRLHDAKRFPVGNKFYGELTHGELGFTKIYQTPCSVFCQITYLGDPVNRFEETANVFDRPIVTIFRKMESK